MHIMVIIDCYRKSHFLRHPEATITRCDLLATILFRVLHLCLIVLKLRLRPDFFVLMLHYCANLKAIRYESTSLNRIVPDKSYRVIVA